MGLSLPKRNRFSDALGAIGRGASRTFDQINPLDNGRTWQQTTPTQDKSAFQQAEQARNQIAKDTVGGLAKMANTAIYQAPQVAEIARTATAALTNNPNALAASAQRMDTNQNRFKNSGGILNQGSLYNSTEARRGDFKTGITKIGGGTLQGMAEAYSLGTGANVSGAIKDLGVISGIQSQLPALGKSFAGNVFQGGITTANQGGNWKDVAKGAALSGVSGTVGDVGLGLTGAIIHPHISSVAGKVYGATKPKVDFQSGPKAFVIKEGVPTTQPLKIKAGVPLANNPLQKPKVGFQVTDSTVPSKFKIVDNSVPKQISGAAQQSMLSKVRSSIKPLKEVGSVPMDSPIMPLNRLAKNSEDYKALAKATSVRTEMLKKQGKITPKDEGYWSTPIKGQPKTPIPEVKDTNGLTPMEGDKIEFDSILPGQKGKTKKGTATVRWSEPSIANASGKEMPGQWLGNGALDSNLPFTIVERNGKPIAPQVGKTPTTIDNVKLPSGYHTVADITKELKRQGITQKMLDDTQAIDMGTFDNSGKVETDSVLYFLKENSKPNEMFTPQVGKTDPLDPNSFAKVFGGTEQQATKVLDTPNPTMEKAVTTIMQKEGLTADKARVKVNKILKESTGTELKDTITPGVPLRVEGNPTKNPQVREVLQGLSKARGKAGVEGSQVAGSISSKAKELGVPVDQGFIDRFQAGKLKGDEKLLGDHIKSLTDLLFKKQAELDNSIQYRKNYVPQSYANTADEVASAIKKLQTSTGAAKRREFNTYAEAAQYGLTPKFQSIDQMIGVSAQKAEGALQNRDLIKKGIESGVLSTDPNMGIQVVGLKAPGGAPVFAQKEVADTINGVLQKGTGTLARTLNKTAEGAGLAQDVMLQGGIPWTNANFFVAGQAVKDTTRNIGKAPFHPIQAVKQEANLVGDFFRGKDATVKRFTQDSFKANGAEIPNSTFVRDLANQGLYIQPQTAMSGMTKGTVRKAWDSLGNNPTFGRYMPNRLLSTAQEVYSQTVGDLGHDAAIKLAADTTKTFTGQVDTILKGRSNIANDISSVALFAPKYRESIVNSLTNVVKSVYPSKWNDPTFKPSRELLGGMAATLAGYEALNMKLNGHSMFENRQGQELSLQIPYGQKDEKGNQKVVNVPFMPGFMTIPRAIGSAAVAVKNGDVKGVVAQGSKALSAPLQIIGNVTGNKDYFDRPIYLDQKNADAEGVNPDSAGVASKKVAGYVAGQLSPAWVRGVIDKASGKPTVQALATALEAPVRFGKQVNPDTLAYFKDRDAVYNSLDKNDRAVWDTIHPKLKNVNGEYIVDKSVDSGLARASNYLDRPKVLAAENEMAQRAKARGQKVDPLFDLPGDQQRIALRMDTLPPKDPNKTILRKQNPWYNDFTAQRSAFFDSLPPGDPNKPKGPISYPEASPQTQSLVDAYYQLQDPTQKRNMLTSNPDIADQFAKEEQYSRAVRAAKNLPQYDKYPEPPKDVQNLLDFYTSMPKGEGANGKSPTRSAWIKSHPNEWAKLTDQFSKQAQYSLQQDASLAQFEGQDLTEKGIKSIESLAKSLGMSTGGGGYGNGGRSDGGFNTATYMNGISTPGGTSRKITIKAPTVAIKAKATKVSRPKVTIKKALT